jgi:outer membrane protein assembly factor BamB
VYVGGANGIQAFNALTGQAMWTTTSGVRFGEVTAAGGDVYGVAWTIGTGPIPPDREAVYAFDAKTGLLVWSSQPQAVCCIPGPVTVVGGLAYVAVSATASRGGSQLVAYNAATGALVFSSATADAGGGGVMVSGGKAFLINLANCAMQAFDANSGVPVWTTPPVTAAGYCGDEEATDGAVVVENSGRYLIGLAANTGTQLWSLDAGTFPAGFSGGPAIANGVVYVSQTSGGLEAIDEATGRVLYSSGIGCGTQIVAHSSVYAWCTSASMPLEMTVFGL